jgi:hypothetical protein
MENKIDLKCIGFKWSYMKGFQMWYYKFTQDGKEFLIVDAGMIKLIDMVWNQEKDNDFSNADLSDEMLEKIEAEIKVTEKVDKELSEDEENSFFTHCEVLPEKKIVYKRKNRKYDDDEFNELLRVIDHQLDFFYSEGKTQKITEEMIKDLDEDEKDLIKDLVGYEFRYSTDGSHKNDGQMVEYDITFTSPKGKETNINTEMCLMVGWNYSEEVKIK